MTTVAPRVLSPGFSSPGEPRPAFRLHPLSHVVGQIEVHIQRKGLFGGRIGQQITAAALRMRESHNVKAIDYSLSPPVPLCSADPCLTNSPNTMIMHRSPNRPVAETAP